MPCLLLDNVFLMIFDWYYCCYYYTLSPMLSYDLSYSFVSACAKIDEVELGRMDSSQLIVLSSQSWRQMSHFSSTKIQLYYLSLVWMTRCKIDMDMDIYPQTKKKKKWNEMKKWKSKPKTQAQKEKEKKNCMNSCIIIMTIIIPKPNPKKDKNMCRMLYVQPFIMYQ